MRYPQYVIRICCVKKDTLRLVFLTHTSWRSEILYLLGCDKRAVVCTVLSYLKPVQGTSVSRNSQEIIGLQNTGKDIRDRPVSTFLHGQEHLPPDKPPVPPQHLWALNCQASSRWCRMTCSWLTRVCPAPAWVSSSIRVLAHCSLKSVPQLTAWTDGMRYGELKAVIEVTFLPFRIWIRSFWHLRGQGKSTYRWQGCKGSKGMISDKVRKHRFRKTKII